MLERVRIILVEPSGSANVGSAARVMANMGLSDLRIVAPRCDVAGETATNFAAHGRDVLAAARVVFDLDEALAGCVKSYATSSKLGLYRRQSAEPPDVAAAELVSLASSGGAVAVVFGREDFGLRTSELLRFDGLITIPSADGYPVLNLATSVAIVCYELRLAQLCAAGQPALPMALPGAAADDAQKRVLFERLFDALERVGFLWGQNPEHLKHALRQIFGRANLSQNDADILIGMARQIRWYVEHHPRRDDS